MTIEHVGEFLKSHQIKPSYQRLKVFEYLANTTAHPTVDTIYKALLPEIPTLSKTTVYNTLNLFVDQGIAQLITIEENEARYDADISSHGHFKCESCEQVLDFRMDLGELSIKGHEGCKIHHKHLYFKGVCKDCQ